MGEPEPAGRGQQAGIVAHGNPAGDGWALGLGPKRKLAIVTGGATVQTKVTLSSNVWTMVTVTWSDKVRVYLNGALKKAFNGGPATGSGAFVLGGNGAGAFSGSFSGKLDEVALYSAALERGPDPDPLHRGARAGQHRAADDQRDAQPSARR